MGHNHVMSSFISDSGSTHPLPAIYIPHGGGPCFFMDWTMGPPDTWVKMADWMRALGDEINTGWAKPKAILVISAHWEEAEITVLGQSNPSLLYDYYGFPPHTYQLKYEASGSPELAQTVIDLLQGAGLASQLNTTRGLDHGVFIPLKLIYPAADIPVIQVSLKAGLDPATHIAMGRALAPLRSQGVLIIGSGMSYHNMQGFFRGDGLDDSRKFDSWLTTTVETPDVEARNQNLVNWSLAPAARASHPREEHLIPLMVVAGAAGDDKGYRIFSDEVMNARVSAYQFGNSKA